MVQQEMVKMSPKGQLVVPKEIRKNEKFQTSDRFVAFEVKDGVLFKRVNIPNVKAEFKTLSKEIEKRFREKKVTEKNVEEAVQWARRK